MKGYVLPGVLGLLLGLTLHWTGLSRPGALRDALGLRRSHALRSVLYMIGVPMALTALLCWLAVIDVDGVAVLPLSAGALAGGVVFGVSAALCGYTPLTAFAGLGSGRTVEALCTLAGCLTAALLLPLLEKPLTALYALPPTAHATMFRTTLDEPYLLGGGFRGQFLAGVLVMVVAICIPSNLGRFAAAPAVAEDAPPDDAAGSDAAPEEEAEAALPAPEPVALLPAAAPEEAFVALLPGEEPLVVDTEMDAPPENSLPEAPSPEEGPSEPGASEDEAPEDH
ncbi:MAG: YeeE/YedE family protein [Clostridia bacterium]|nr:YeeE/YedE family protein [Clostridia bacterium]